MRCEGKFKEDCDLRARKCALGNSSLTPFLVALSVHFTAATLCLTKTAEYTYRTQNMPEENNKENQKQMHTI